MSNCIVCSKQLNGKQQKYCSSKCKNSVNQSYTKQQTRGKNRRLSLIHLFGGCCQICGYNKNYAALCFHHIDPTVKEHKLTIRELSNNAFNKMVNESEKCMLLCHNCHMEIHHPQYTNQLS